jgi:pyruvate ferredoxin oxidoreductase beta subunit
MERGHDMIYIVYDNEAYMNTGIQRSSATPFGASTTTQPSGKASVGNKTWKKNMAEIMVAHRVPYVATATHSYPIDFMNKVKKARKVKGPAFIHCLAVCPTGWRSSSETCIKMARLAVETGVFPLYEVENGKYKFSPDNPPKLRPLEDYLKPQGRFRHLKPEDIQTFKDFAMVEYNKVLERVKHSKSWSELK